MRSMLLCLVLAVAGCTDVPPPVAERTTPQLLKDGDRVSIEELIAFLDSQPDKSLPCFVGKRTEVISTIDRIAVEICIAK